MWTLVRIALDSGCYLPCDAALATLKSDAVQCVSVFVALVIHSDHIKCVFLSNSVHFRVLQPIEWLVLPRAACFVVLAKADIADIASTTDIRSNYKQNRRRGFCLKNRNFIEFSGIV